jgi:hypothetical protein
LSESNLGYLKAALTNEKSAVFFYFLLPEMKGRSLEEIDEMFEKRISVRNFATYECECTRQAHEIAMQKKMEAGVIHSELGVEKEQ